MNDDSLGRARTPVHGRYRNYGTNKSARECMQICAAHTVYFNAYIRMHGIPVELSLGLVIICYDMQEIRAR